MESIANPQDTTDPQDSALTVDRSLFSLNDPRNFRWELDGHLIYATLKNRYHPNACDDVTNVSYLILTSGKA